MFNIKNKLKNILVSGGAGDIGIAIGRILLDEKIENIIGCDITDDHAGECLFDYFYTVPRADQQHYFSVLQNIFIEQHIELFIPSSEAEIKALIDHGLKDGCLFDVPVLIADEQTIRVALDKQLTADFLLKNKIKNPWTLSTEKTLPKSLPCIFKPRSGQGSKGLEIINCESRAETLLGTRGYIWQELLLPDNEEYTCGVYRGGDAVTFSIVLRRTLSGGFTSKGEVIENEEITNYIETIASALNVKGAVNFQLRLTKEGPVLFEINPRFSSTVMFRHKLGFNDLIWAIDEKLGETRCPYTPASAGTKFYRGYTEYIK